MPGYESHRGGTLAQHSDHISPAAHSLRCRPKWFLSATSGHSPSLTTVLLPTRALETFLAAIADLNLKDDARLCSSVNLGDPGGAYKVARPARHSVRGSRRARSCVLREEYFMSDGSDSESTLTIFIGGKKETHLGRKSGSLTFRCRSVRS